MQLGDQFSFLVEQKFLKERKKKKHEAVMQGEIGELSIQIAWYPVILSKCSAFVSVLDLVRFVSGHINELYGVPAEVKSNTNNNVGDIFSRIAGVHGMQMKREWKSTILLVFFYEYKYSNFVHLIVSWKNWLLLN